MVVILEKNFQTFWKLKRFFKKKPRVTLEENPKNILFLQELAEFYTENERYSKAIDDHKKNWTRTWKLWIIKYYWLFFIDS